MKNKLIFTIGLILLFVIVWAVTMICMEFNSKEKDKTLPQAKYEILIDNTMNY